ncbi:FkbM family methyltransferase [Psychroflexus sp. YR1-1]|uniref:FkbM family methyltransferase n=1 Tax=Psychroflexus aurantiacus TaxID=2709310 RepID=A0A6B3R071_9FLAO|nr:FkbM family methyltransferase [Psychroflexus aurantiacus]NEV93953.1 FkbM family methyltransferase [Psychroflexus aurantiacus]
MRIVKNIIKKITNKLGYEIITFKNYNQLALNKKDYKSNTYAKNNLLDNFFTILINQNYYPETIYDIGANKGTWTKECLKYFPDATYYLFEPQINLKTDLDLLFKKHKNIHLFSVGVGHVNDELNFTMHKRDDSCTFSFSEQEAQNRGFNQIKAPIVKLESFVKENNLKTPSILKIDAEGLDLKVLEGASNLLNNVEIIMVEVGIMNGRIKNSALIMSNYLDEKGFKLFDITDINRPFSNKVLWLCEFVYIKKNGKLDKNYAVENI